MTVFVHYSEQHHSFYTLYYNLAQLLTDLLSSPGMCTLYKLKYSFPFCVINYPQTYRVVFRIVLSQQLTCIILCSSLVCSYTPALPQKHKPLTQKFDYSHVKSKIDTRRPSSVPPTARYSSEHSARTKSAKVKHFNSTFSTFSPTSSKITGHSDNQLSRSGIRVSSSAKYSHITSRIDTGRPASLQSSKSTSSAVKAKDASRLPSSKPSRSAAYSHIKSRIDSGVSSTLEQKSSNPMSHDKVNLSYMILNFSNSA